MRDDCLLLHRQMKPAELARHAPLLTSHPPHCHPRRTAEGRGVQHPAKKTRHCPSERKCTHQHGPDGEHKRTVFKRDKPTEIKHFSARFSNSLHLRKPSFGVKDYCDYFDLLKTSSE